MMQPGEDENLLGGDLLCFTGPRKPNQKEQQGLLTYPINPGSLGFLGLCDDIKLGGMRKTRLHQAVHIQNS